MPGIPTITDYALPTAGDLPPRTVDWQLTADRAVLLIHDMQRYFLAPLPPALREELIGNVALVRARCAELGVPVAYTAQPGRMSERERGLLKDFWGPGMRTDADDRAVVAPLTPQPGDWQITKWRYSAFFRSPLRQRMRAAGRDQLIVCGVYAHVGVLMSTVDAFSHDIQPFLVADAIADFSEADHRMALNYAAARCAAVLTSKEVLP
jgi:isochorismate hydrolase